MGETRFWKYHGLGNDFVLIDWRGHTDIDPQLVRSLCHRHTGIGADGILALKEGDNGTPQMRVFNADGSVADMCGNGLRCFVRWLVDEMGYSASPDITVGSDAGNQVCTPIMSDQSHIVAVRVNLGAPAFAGVPDVSVGGNVYSGHDLFLGNPHFVIPRAPEAAEPEHAGPSLSIHQQFPRDTNVEWLNCRDSIHADVVVYERGVGLTQACGTGGGAAAAVAVKLGRMQADTDLTITQPGGKLIYRVASDLSSVWMTGPAEPVFTGTANFSVG